MSMVYSVLPRLFSLSDASLSSFSLRGGSSNQSSLELSLSPRRTDEGRERKVCAR